MKRIILSIFLFALLYGSATAQQVLSLKECQERALRQNVKIRQSQIDISMAKETRSVARSHYIPTVAASFAAFNASDNLINIPLPTLPMVGPLGSMGLVNDGQVGGVTATLPLYAGGRIHNSNKLADLALEVAKLQLSQNESEVMLTTAVYYWQVVMLKEKLCTLDIVDTQLGEIRKNADAAVSAGITLRNDILQISLKQNDLQSARLKVSDALAISRMLLAQYAGLGLDSVDAVYPVDYQLPPSPASLYVAPDMAVAQTQEYQLLNQNLKAQKLQQKITLGKNLPSLALGGSYNYMNLLDKGQTFWMGFATVSVPISSWLGGTHEMRKQRMAVEKAQISLHDNSELLQLNMINKWNKVNESYRQLSLSLNSIEQSAENLRLQTNQYQAGVSTMSDLLEAQTLYQKSRDQYVDAFTTYQVACAEYHKATGR